jgi:hypothetical protein
MGLNGKGFNVTLVVGGPTAVAPTVALPVTAAIALPVASATVPLPALPPGAKMSDEYMAAVAVSLQKTKELEVAQN